MGWGYGILIDGREAGYTVKAICEQPGCETVIDRGLAYACGGMHEAGSDYCAGYFCYEHLAMTARGQRCLKCAILIPEEEDMMSDKGTPKQDGSGHGTQDNKGRGGCADEDQKGGQGKNPKKG